MAEPATGTSRPGVSVGPTSEFSLFFRVRPGHGDALREALRTLQNHPGYRPGDYHVAIASIHEARFVLFDDDTRLLFATSFDGPWDAYMDDFVTSGPTLRLFDAIFQHVEGYEGLPDVAAVKAFVLGAQVTRGRVRPELPRHGQGDPQGRAREQGVPAGARRPGGRYGAAAAGPEAAARRGRRHLASLARESRSAGAMEECGVGPHLGAAGVGRADRGHHRRLRLSEPGAFRPPRAGDEHPAVRPAIRAVLRRADLPLPVAPGHRGHRGRSWRRSPSARRSSPSTACSPPRSAAAAGPTRTARAPRRRARRSSSG